MVLGAMTRIIVCCDGLAPSYLETVDTPSLDAIGDAGRAGTCDAAIPSLTNVNNVSIATGGPPSHHGITGNTYYDRETDELVYMKDPEYLRATSKFEAAVNDGASVGALVAKEKLERMIGQGCTIAASAESPPAWLESAVGPAPDIYSGAASRWLLRAADATLDAYDLDWLYVSTTDVVPHKHPPDDPAATKWVRDLDAGIAQLHRRARDIAITADHGMSAKTTCLDLETFLTEAGFETTVVRLIRDAHTYHHQNLGGAAYVYIHDDQQPAAACAAIEELTEVDLALTGTDAADMFSLPADRIGDVLALGSGSTVFGPLDEGVTGSVELRSHGSHFEQEVPYRISRDVDLDANYELFNVLAAA